MIDTECANTQRQASCHAMHATGNSQSGVWSSPDEALVGAGQVGPHGIVLQTGDAVIGRFTSDVDSAGTAGVQPSAGHHQTVSRQHAWQSTVAAAIGGGAIVALLHKQP